MDKDYELASEIINQMILKYTKKEAEDLINKISDMVGSSYNDDYGYEVDDEDLLDFGL